MTYNLITEKRAFTDNEFLKKFMLEVVEIMCPENKMNFKK